jgi:hypothetical protein
LAAPGWYPASMKRYLLAWATAVFFTGPPATAQSSVPAQPDALVRNLYREVVARQPHDIPEGTDWQSFAPYLSKGLLHRIDLARSCSADRDRQSLDGQLMARIVSGYGLFSGDDSSPQAFQIEKTEAEKDGSSRVYVRLTWETPSQRPFSWPVAAVVIREDGRFVIDDVLYIDDHIYDREADRRHERLSEYLSAGCDGAHWSGRTLPKQPEAFVQSLYDQVLVRRPIGIPGGPDWKVFAPYLSTALLHRIDLALYCGEDWGRQHPDPNLKPEIGWLELGTFSGGDDELELRAFHIERTESAKDGSLRVYVRLIWGYPPEETWISNVAATVVRENGNLFIDDITYLRDEPQDAEARLSSSLSAGCDGPHWVGFHDSK